MIKTHFRTNLGSPVVIACKQPIFDPLWTSRREAVTCKNCLRALAQDDYEHGEGSPK